MSGFACALLISVRRTLAGHSRSALLGGRWRGGKLVPIVFAVIFSLALHIR